MAADIDDLTVPDDEKLWQRIPPWWFHSDESVGRLRPAKAAFDDDSDGGPMSVVITSEAENPEATLAGHPGFALVSFTAGLARSFGQRIVRDPTPEEPAHALVDGRKTDGIKRRLARAATWVVPPPPF